MNRFLKLLSLCLFLTLTVPLQAVTNGVANEPDSVYLFSYSHADGSGGLKLAWSPDGNRWFSVADGNSFVNSDFGPWGANEADAETALDADPCRRPLALHLGTDGKRKLPRIRRVSQPAAMESAEIL